MKFSRYTTTNSIQVVLLVVFTFISITVGVADWQWSDFFKTDGSNDLFFISRLPRTLAIILTGATLAISGIIIQILLKNRFIEPTMIGATQSASLGLLLLLLYFPAAPILLKMSVASLTALLGMLLFLLILKRLPPTNQLLIPVIGIIFAGIIEAVATFIAYETDTLQLLNVWIHGDFSAVLLGRYELLWLTGIMAIIAYMMADQLTIVGLGKTISFNLGLNYQQILWSGLVIVALITSMVVVTVGTIPFIGLIVPNIVSRLCGDSLRKNLPTVALMGANLVLLCDILGRVIRYPYEIPVSTLFGVIGTLVFLYLLFVPAKQRQTKQPQRRAR